MSTAAPGAYSTARTITQLQRRRDEDPETRPLDMGLILRLMRYTQPYALKRNLLLGLVLLRAVQNPCQPALIAYVITGPIAAKDLHGTIVGMVAYGLLAAFTQLTLRYRQKLAMELGESVVHDLHRDIFHRLQSLTMSFYHRTKLGSIISRMTSDVDSVRQGVQEVLFVTMVNGGQMLIAAGFMWYYDHRLFLMLLGLAPILYGINRVFRKRLSRIYRELQESYSRVTATLAESVSGIRVTQGFVRQDVNAELFHDLVADHSEMNVSAAKTTGTFLPLLEFNNQLFYGALLVAAGYLVFRPHVDDAEALAQADALVGFFMMATQFFNPIQTLAQQYNHALTAMAGAERVFKLLDTRPDWCDPPDAMRLASIAGRVEFQDVDFQYVPDKPVLAEVNFIAEPGQTIALVGHTGSGKSTIINLIAKFYLPTAGKVLIDGHDLTLVNTDSLHRQMGIVLQSNFLFTGTVIDNIRIGKPEAADAEVIEAARKLDVLDLLEAMPEGLQTNVGERGGLMSLGQRQIVCFCRAMLANPRIMILDEATSSVDTMTEARIQKALAVLLKGRTSFVVAHRLSTIRQASRILVLDQGRIIERGTHIELLTSGGVYAHLYRKFVRASEE